MEKGNTKKEILNAALDLFSTQGYEATSISQIASAVGIKKASLYSHYESKKEILDLLIQEVLFAYDKHSIFTTTDWINGQNLPSTKDDIIKMLKGQVAYIIHEPFISKARKMLVIEQFQNQELAKLQTKQNYSDIVSFCIGMANHLKKLSLLDFDDVEIVAMQTAFPINVWINLCDREPNRESEIMNLIDRHLNQIFKVYGSKNGK